MQFNARNPDDIFKVLDCIQNSQILDDENAKAFVVSLKLFDEGLLENKDIPLFKDFMPQFVQFMKNLKQTIKTQQNA